MIAEDASGPALEQHDAPDRRLRNLILIANAVAWILISILISLISF